MLPYGTIRYHNGTIWYHMVPYGTVWSPPSVVGSPACLGTKVFLGNMTFEQIHWKRQQWQTIVTWHHLSGNLNYLISGKEPQRNSGHSGFGIIENGQFCTELWHFLALGWIMICHILYIYTYEVVSLYSLWFFFRNRGLDQWDQQNHVGDPPPKKG